MPLLPFDKDLELDLDYDPLYLPSESYTFSPKTNSLLFLLLAVLKSSRLDVFWNKDSSNL